MNLKQYLRHFIFWLRTFPTWNTDTHTTVGIAGSGEYSCLICDYTEKADEDTEEREGDG